MSNEAIKIDDQAFYPVVLQAESWSVSFKLQPECAVIVTGIKPTYSEFAVASASCCGGVGVLTQSLYVAACVAFDSK